MVQARERGIKVEKRARVSESIRLGTLLTFVGGFLDAYSYLTRGGVFANAETGNIVLMGIHLAQGQWRQAIFYLFPITCFPLGIFAAEWFKKHVGEKKMLHWKESVLFLEIFVLFIAGFLPQQFNSLVNSSIAFVCALQVEAFRKMHGMAFATTMCTGNLRSGTELLTVGAFEHDSDKKKKGLWYYWIDVAFVIGGAAGTICCRMFAERSVWVGAVLLVGAVCFIQWQKRKQEV